MNAPAATLVDLLRARAQERPGAVAHLALDARGEPARSMDYGLMERRARAVAARLSRRCAPGERVLLLYPSGLDFVEGFFGALFAGCVPVPAYLPHPFFLKRALPRLRAVVRDSRPAAGLTASSSAALLKSLLRDAPELAALQWEASDEAPDPPAGAWRAPDAAEGDLAVLQYTSGASSDPKGVMLDHRNVLYNAALIHEVSGHSADTVGVLWLPHSHDMGLMSIVQMLYAGCRCVSLSTVDFLRDPGLWLRTITRHRGTSSPAPNFAYELCLRRVASEERAGLDLSSWDMAYDSAEPARAETIDRFSAAFAPYGFRREAFYPCYGLAEATVLASGGEKARPPVIASFDRAALARGSAREAAPGESAATLVGCGRTLRGQSLVIADPGTGAPLPPGAVGEVRVAGPSVARGYWEREEETRRVFEEPLPGGGPRPFLRTGDLGFLRDEELFLVGRLKDLILINGLKHHPEDLERTVEACHEGVRQSGAAAFSIDEGGEERLVVVVELDRPTRAGETDEALARVRETVWRVHQVRVHEAVAVKPGAIPKTASGKTRRGACREEYLTGKLARLKDG